MDPDRLLQCPYDKNHQIRASRFPYHLVKCRQNNLKIARQLVTCPYNARHRIPKDEFNAHVETCENKVPLEMCGVNTSLKSGDKEKTAWQCPPPTEDWEADAEENPARPFVFGACISGQDNWNLDPSLYGCYGNPRKGSKQDSK